MLCCMHRRLHLLYMLPGFSSWPATLRIDAEVSIKVNKLHEACASCQRAYKRIANIRTVQWFLTTCMDHEGPVVALKLGKESKPDL